MSTRPPSPPPRGPSLGPPDRPSTLRKVLKAVGLTIGAFAVLVVVGFGLLLFTCGGI